MLNNKLKVQNKKVILLLESLLSKGVVSQRRADYKSAIVPPLPKHICADNALKP
jgi:hypothetical protein